VARSNGDRVASAESLWPQADHRQLALWKSMNGHPAQGRSQRCKRRSTELCRAHGEQFHQNESQTAANSGSWAGQHRRHVINPALGDTVHRQ